MEKIAQPTPEQLRKAQAALTALNVAYEYFSPLPATPVPSRIDDNDLAKAA